MSLTQTSLNIVLVEDHDLLRTVTESVLKEAGHQVLALTCAEEVDEALSFMNPDLYILDLNLPGEDGLTLSRRIRKSHPRVGIIMTTARTDISDRLDGYESGADIYLPKPTDPSELLAAAVALARRLHPEFFVDSTSSLQNIPRVDDPNGHPDTLAGHSSKLSANSADSSGEDRRLGDSVLLLSTQSMRLVGVRQQVLLTFSEVQLLSGFARTAGGVLERWQIASILDIDMDTVRGRKCRY